MRRARAETKKAVAEPFAAARKRYAALVRSVRGFAASRVERLEKEAAALELTARKGAVTYLRLALRELRRLEKELERMERLVAPPAKRARRPRAKKARAALPATPAAA